jgi:putative intracellular protease/amidase
MGINGPRTTPISYGKVVAAPAAVSAEKTYSGITIIGKPGGKGIAIDYPDNKTLIDFIKGIMVAAKLTPADLV